ncbi:hypothetical protein ACMCO3_001547 [Salmonella enterica]|nr:hypothetical protein [Salmonella enterica]EDH6622074.1 hypothetical protein [Salmonella enterica subsp. enterica serovar Monschaui]EAZ5321881.1 hypothetical protein [Salmonella enterica]EAZ6972978.1 hypothetical protein [Salmonella enterica]EBB2377512.1 hypothetical protein [Salmonella enterica]
MTNNKLTDERLSKILSETQETINDHNRRCVRGSVEVDARLFEEVLLELQLRRQADKNYFMYGIATPEGRAYLDEFCVSSDRGLMEDEVAALNDTFDTNGYRVVALYTALPLTDSERAELQERRKADSENLVKDRQRVIDGLCSIGETVWGIEEYMKKWDAKYLPKTSSPAPLQGSQPVSSRDELPCTQLPCLR